MNSPVCGKSLLEIAGCGIKPQVDRIIHLARKERDVLQLKNKVAQAIKNRSVAINFHSPQEMRPVPHKAVSPGIDTGASKLYLESGRLVIMHVIGMTVVAYYYPFRLLAGVFNPFQNISLIPGITVTAYCGLFSQQEPFAQKMV